MIYNFEMLNLERFGRLCLASAAVLPLRRENAQDRLTGVRVGDLVGS